MSITVPADESSSSEFEDSDKYLPARMINECAYCPRLFYLMHVEGQFAPNAETTEGDHVHRRVDAKTDALIPPKPRSTQPSLLDLGDSKSAKPQSSLEKLIEPAPPESNTTESNTTESNTTESTESSEQTQRAAEEERSIHARSVTLASDALGVVAKLDLVEAQGNCATPVDYKRGRPRRDRDGKLTAWLPERIQICLQVLVLRENGFTSDAGVLYFHKTRQRVTIAIDDELIAQTQRMIHRARSVAELSAPPPPLIASPKCPKCSLSAICLPDETNRLRLDNSVGKANGGGHEVRLPSTPRDDLRPLYLNTQGLYVGKKSEILEIKDGHRLVQEVRLRELNQVNLFGNIQVSTQALKSLMELEIPLVMFSQHGHFSGMLQGTGLKNILLRREQFRMADDRERCLKIAKSLVIGKIRNQRVMLMRNHIEPPEEAIKELKRLTWRAERVERAEALLGIEGTAARVYFEHFAGMLKPGDTPLDPGCALGKPPEFRFDFRGRNRRPPRDPVNALLSLVYTLLAKDFTVTAASVGLDPYLGFFHLPRPGRPALALDLMEPFRPLIADSVAISAINNRMVYPEHFVAAGRGVTLTESGRKAVFRAYEQRMDQLITHPWFSYRVSYRRLLEIQTRLLGRYVMGELAEYPAFVTR